MARIRSATPGDALTAARLLVDFNAEFGERTPAVDFLAARYAELIADGDITVLFAEDEEDAVGFAQLRFRRPVWSEELDCYLEELYVVPKRRGQGIGRALLDAVTATAREQGACHLELTTSTDDTEARALYESAGFTNREGPSDGPSMLYYERDL